jgi:hypothetical protein
MAPCRRWRVEGGGHRYWREQVSFPSGLWKSWQKPRQISKKKAYEFISCQFYVTWEHSEGNEYMKNS